MSIVTTRGDGSMIVACTDKDINPVSLNVVGYNYDDLFGAAEEVFDVIDRAQRLAEPRRPITVTIDWETYRRLRDALGR